MAKTSKSKGRIIRPIVVTADDAPPKPKQTKVKKKKTINPREAWVLQQPDSYLFRHLVHKPNGLGRYWEEVKPPDFSFVTRMALEMKAGKYADWSIWALRYDEKMDENRTVLVRPEQILGEEPMVPPEQTEFM
jgi:hypothetical protein